MDRCAVRGVSARFGWMLVTIDAVVSTSADEDVGKSDGIRARRGHA